MSDQLLKSLSDYSQFVAELLSQPPVERSTVMVWSTSPYTGVADLPTLIQEIAVLIQSDK
jgi:hypothetical protein